jgi:hypothetical protein
MVKGEIKKAWDKVVRVIYSTCVRQEIHLKIFEFVPCAHREICQVIAGAHAVIGERFHEYAALRRLLQEDGIPVSALHGRVVQDERVRNGDEDGDGEVGHSHRTSQRATEAERHTARNASLACRIGRLIDLGVLEWVENGHKRDHVVGLCKEEWCSLLSAQLLVCK